MFYLCCVLHQTLSQQGRHRLQLLLSLPDVGVQLEDFLQVAAGGQVVLAEMRGNREARLKTRRPQCKTETQMRMFSSTCKPL